MNSIAEFLKSKIKLVRVGQLPMPKDTPPVNITRILKNPGKILIIPYNRMGTILLAARVFKSFRDSFQSSQITVAVDHTWSILVENDSTIDEVFTFGEEINNPYSKSFQNLGKQLSINNFDIAFYLSYQFETEMAYLTRLSCADLRISFKNDNENQFFNVEIVPSRGIKYEIDRYLEMLRTLGIEGSVRDYKMAVGQSIIDGAKRRFLSGENSRRFVAFDLTKEIVGEPISRKTAESVIKTILNDIKAQVVVVYEPEKRTIAAALKETFGRNIILVEDRPISMVAGMLSFCFFAITHNTDLFQLAATLKIPTLCIMKKEEIIQWSPGEKKEIVHLQQSVGAWPPSSAIVQSARRLVKQNKQP
ncbi:MAG: glycosyltransferase family 9 protein [Candidatus Latescibacteria bacterium]|nr:glycosyltransferase family 9 protein [Candidatus Latescibacterota bacterium]